MIHVVLLSGGSGSRLWPLSNEARSKQFLKVLRNEQGESQSMVQRTFDMLSKVDLEKNVVIATCSAQVASIESQIQGEYEVVVEPERRDTAPAIMLAAARLAFKDGASFDETVVVMPIDTYAEQSYYECLFDIDEAVQQGIADLVLLGVKPTYPSEKFGYIVSLQNKGTAARDVIRFVEKPDEKTAQALMSEGALWNCGVFGFRLGYLLDIVQKYRNVSDFETLRSGYSLLPKNSFDYEIVEKADSVAVIAYEGFWKDLGTWNTLTEEMADFRAGRVVCDDYCENTHVINETGLPMVVAGVRDAVVVATADGIIVSDKQRSAHIKPYVAQIAETRPMFESRQWGEYKVLGQETFDGGMRSLEKMLVVKAGKQLSYQRHECRSEVWTIVDGRGQVVLDGLEQFVSPGSVVVVPARTKHAIRAETDLHVVEVQLGTDLVESDVERFGFFWNV